MKRLCTLLLAGFRKLEKILLLLGGVCCVFGLTEDTWVEAAKPLQEQKALIWNRPKHVPW